MNDASDDSNRGDGEDGDPDHNHGHGHHGNGHDHDHGHDHHRHDISELDFAVLTVSSSRGIDEDAAGDAIIERLEAAGHAVAVRELVNDDYDSVQDTIDRFANRGDVDCVVTTGGTGVTPDDVTVEAAEQLFDKRLPGFGELFRSLSREEIGTRVVGTRATAGIADGTPVFCLPGSENAVELGTESIVLEEAPHLAGLARRDDAETENGVEAENGTESEGDGNGA
ncbi:MogA/MoaB family molybdenum cofactor biosynthesis protein [Natronomonas sp. F2-12]|jgi:molybdenum cofactor biosynthesis protein B|uniref:MogA/MoaB family molybdenum cofactor biosynthesis protein n=1 Tax=Natronomonas aquatica TaxID=2841590 RepID=A0A9R1CRF0_9EURY|nr:MogA/MoaB family molybdenum cofactor biosynthesis protein [Natronomonas aquatica]MCQ4332627.1 MogA/MoaB family molybdenum cofactor biosynthesis protein [Natronomonas aquatica]